jgi:hypothetical protein
MQLTVARLCANCENVHDERTCPACGSETFTYLTNWVPTTSPDTPRERRRFARPEMRKQVVLGGGLLGLAAFWIGRWSKRARHEVEMRSVGRAGELR